MKAIMYRSGIKETKDRKFTGFSFERLLLVIFAASFILLLIIQSALTNNDARTVISTSPQSEGVPLEDEVSLFDKGSIVLKLCNSEYDPNVIVLVNGIETAVFKENPVNIDVKKDDIIEVDGSSAGYKAEIEVLSASDNISASCVGKKTVTNSNVKKLVVIRTK